MLTARRQGIATIRRAAIAGALAALALIVAVGAQGPTAANANGAAIQFTILNTNDFHGQLQLNGSNPGLARVAAVVNAIRTAKGAGNVLLTDSGDEMQGSLLSNLQRGVPTIAGFDATQYDVATFGNHEFDWGQQTLADRTAQAAYPFVTANIVKNDTGNCATAGWTKPDFATAPYVVKTVNGVKVAFIGVTTQETPTITIATATQNLCFKDPTAAIEHYYADMQANADVTVVLSHLGYADGGYGYGIPVYGDQTLAKNLLNAGMPVPLIIGGHSHTNLNPATVVTVGGKSTTITQSYYNGRVVGQEDLTFDPASKAVTVAWTRNTVSTTGPEDPVVKAVIDNYANDPAYQALVNQPIGYSAVDLPRSGGTVDNMMGTFVDDAIYDQLNSDKDPTNDIDVFFNNAGGIRTDWCWNGSDWVNTGCTDGTHAPGLLTYGDMFTILPFGNATVVGTMTGAQILQVLNQAPLVSNGVIQPADMKYTYYAYRDANPGPQPWAWGAFDYTIYDKSTHTYVPLDMNKTYKVGTNEFLAPGGGDGYGGFKYMQNITYWGDMLNSVDAYVSSHYGDAAHAYLGPKADGTLDGRIARDGTDSGGSIVPVTILHNNDSHGNLAKTGYVGYTQLATLIKQERVHNPTRTVLLNGGDQIQGDAMSYYFKTSFSGFASNGDPLPPALQTNPMMAVMNSLGYDAMALGNHEFNFGNTVFKGVLGQATFPLLGANVTDDGRYGLAAVDGGQGVKPYIEKTLPGPQGNIRLAILGLTNHRVPNYELPSNILGLTFSNPIDTAAADISALDATNDAVVALTHIGFTTNPRSVEVDNNVDTNLAADVPGIDAIVGAHSHTNPTSPETPYQFLPTIVGNPIGAPVLVTQAYRYNNYLGEVVLGLRANAGGGYDVVSRAGQYIAVTSTTPEDPATKAIVDPYVQQLNSYNNQVVGQTTAPIDTLKAFTEETNGANLQADASIWELDQHGIHPDVHLSGAMTNRLMAPTATEANPATLRVSDMFGGMPYENSLVVLKMNGPQLKAVLERAYRNYYYYKYVPGYGGYSYYTTCMIDTNSMGRVLYKDTYPNLPDGNNVVAFTIGGKAVDFTDATHYYDVSTVNYLAAGSCNFNDNGVSLWPLNQIVDDTQYYVRDAVIDYMKAQGIVSPKIEGRLLFQGVSDTTEPVITPDVVGTTGDNGWYRGDVSVKWTVADPDSPVMLTTGCADASVKTDTAGVTFTCTATSAGGTASRSVTIKRDATAPVVHVTNVIDGSSYDYGLVPVADCSTTDAPSGVAKYATASLTGGPLGHVVVTCAGALDNAGNAASASVGYTVIGGSLVIEDVYGDLEALAPPDKQTADKIDHALAKLDKSLDAKLWVDPLHPSVKQGNEAFDLQRDAVRELMRIKSPDGTTTDSIARLVAQARVLAEIGIGEAAGGNADHLEHAATEVAKGDEEWAADHFDKAIEHYRNAWQEAVKA